MRKAINRSLSNLIMRMLPRQRIFELAISFLLIPHFRFLPSSYFPIESPLLISSNLPAHSLFCSFQLFFHSLVCSGLFSFYPSSIFFHLASLLSFLKYSVDSFQNLSIPATESLVAHLRHKSIAHYIYALLLSLCFEGSHSPAFLSLEASFLLTF